MFENNSDFDLDDEFEDMIASSFTPSGSNDRFFNNVNKSVGNVVQKIQANVQSNSYSNKFAQTHLFKKPHSSADNNINETNIVAAKSLHQSPRVTKKVVKRKFPGPAGLLPDERLDSTNFHEILHFKRTKEKSASDNDDEIVCSQQSATTYEDGPWAEMEKDFNSSLGEDSNLYNKYNIRWIKNAAGAKKLISQKVPFLAAIIQSVDGNMALTNVNLTLKDMTGEIEAAILHTLYQEYSEELIIGSVIVLKQFGVITASSNRHYLTITQNNLIAIYTGLVKPFQDSPSSINNLENQHVNNHEEHYPSQVRSSKMVKKTLLQRVSSEEFVRQIEDSFISQEKVCNKMHCPNVKQSSSSILQEKTFNNFQSKDDAVKVSAKYLNTVSSSVQNPPHKNPSDYSRTHELASSLSNQTNAQFLTHKNRPFVEIDPVESISTPEDYQFFLSNKTLSNRNDFIQNQKCQFSKSSCSNLIFNANIESFGRNKGEPYGNSDINSLESRKTEDSHAGHQTFQLVLDKNKGKPKVLEKKFNFDTKTVNNIFDTDLDDVCFEDFIPDSYDPKNVNNNSAGFDRFDGIDDERSSLKGFAGRNQVSIDKDDSSENSYRKNKISNTRVYVNEMNNITILKTNQNIPSKHLVKNKLEMFKFKPKNCDTIVNEDTDLQEKIVIRGKENENNVQVESCGDNSVIISSSQLSVRTTNKEHNQIWKNVLDDLDADSLFEDF